MRIRVIYDETTYQMKEVGWRGKLKIEACRKATTGTLRYCLHDSVLYLPKDVSVVEKQHRLCWGSFNADEIEDFPWLTEFDKPVPVNPLSLDIPFSQIGFGTRYSRRHKETPEGRKAVESFVTQSLIDKLNANTDALISIDKRDFEELIAELYARQGFEVDLFRTSKDDGIDFLAVRNDDTKQPILLAVQTKHPDSTTTRGNRRALPVATVREIYGVAKAWNLNGAIAVTSSRYSSAAKKFADLKPEEIQVVDGKSVLDWVKKYMWNDDE